MLTKEERREKTRDRILKEVSNFVLLSDIAMSTGDVRLIKAAKNCIKVAESLCSIEGWDLRYFVQEILRLEETRAASTIKAMRILRKQFAPEKQVERESEDHA